MADSKTSQGDHFFHADGVEFHYRVHGHGPFLVFGSVGWGMPGAYLWAGMDPHFESKYAVLYYEPRGNGQSSKPFDPSTMSSKVMSEDYEHLRNYLGWEKFPLLAGHSNGACTTLRYAELYPQRVEKLILIDAEIQDSPPNNSFQDWMAKRREDPVYGPALGALMSAIQNPPQTDEEFSNVLKASLAYYFADTAKSGLMEKQMLSGKVQPSIWAYLNINKQDRAPDSVLPHVAEAHKVTAKTLVVWGEKDAMCSLVAARAITEALPNARLEVIQNAGHFPWVEQPDAFYKLVDEFVKAY